MIFVIAKTDSIFVTDMYVDSLDELADQSSDVLMGKICLDNASVFVYWIFLMFLRPRLLTKP